MKGPFFFFGHIAESKEAITPQKLANAVNFWTAQNIAAGADANTVRKTLSTSTARRYLKAQGFRWKDLTKGLYNDGHEREDVVDYRDNTFLPMMTELRPRAFSSAGNYQSEKRTRLQPATIQAACLLKAWWHDEVLGFDSLLFITLDPEDPEQDSELDSGLSAGEERREGSGAGEEGGDDEEGGDGTEGGDGEEGHGADDGFAA
jgi:hypothetical protein